MSKYNIKYTLSEQDAQRIDEELARKSDELKREAKSIGDCIAEFMDQRALRILQPQGTQVRTTIKEFKAFIATRPTLCLVEYKRLNPTTKEWEPASHRFMNLDRKIVECNSVGFVFHGGSEMSWPRKDELKEWDTQHIVIELENMRFTYEIK